MSHIVFTSFSEISNDENRPSHFPPGQVGYGSKLPYNAEPIVLEVLVTRTTCRLTVQVDIPGHWRVVRD